MQKFFALQKFDERAGTVYGVMTAEEPDKSGEIFDYAGGGKEDVQRWSNECVASTKAAGQEVSLGPIRLQHDPSIIAGKAVRIDYDDNKKTIGLLSEPVNEEIRDMCRRGFVRGYSIAGDYQSRTCNECGADMLGNRSNVCTNCGQEVLVRFVPRIVECSYVDSPCVTSATFEYVKADGATELRKFAPKESSMKLFQHFEDAAKFHRACANSKSACAESYNKLARGAEGRADFATAKAYRAIADEHGKIAAAHSAHAEQLSTMANGGPDVWGLAVETVNADGAPSNQKVADSFFSKFFYGEPGERPGNRATDPVPALSTPQSMFE